MKTVFWGTCHHNPDTYYVGLKDENEQQVFKLCECMDEFAAEELALAYANEKELSIQVLDGGDV